MKNIAALLVLSLFPSLYAQEGYTAPPDPLVAYNPALPDYLQPEFPVVPVGEPGGTPSVNPPAEPPGFWRKLVDTIIPYDVDWPRTGLWTGSGLGALFAGNYLVNETAYGSKDDTRDLTPAEQAALDQSRADAAAGTGGEQATGALSVRFLLSGSFSGAQIVLDCGDFLPLLVFSGNFNNLNSGSIVNWNVSQTCLPKAEGGQWTWRQISDEEIEISGSDSFYVGRAHVSESGLVLGNGFRLSGGEVQIQDRE